MLLGNKCDMEDMRVVSKAKGEQVNFCDENLSAWVYCSRWRAEGYEYLFSDRLRTQHPLLWNKCKSKHQHRKSFPYTCWGHFAKGKSDKTEALKCSRFTENSSLVSVARCLRTPDHTMPFLIIPCVVFFHSPLHMWPDLVKWVGSLCSVYLDTSRLCWKTWKIYISIIYNNNIIKI